MEIEEVAKTDPKSIIVEPIDIQHGVTNEIADRVIDSLELQSEREQAREQIRNLYNMFVKLDST